jgi:two-component system phosphate regulon response regulator PhoB
MTRPKPRILLVEDDSALAAAYRTRMEAEGFDVRDCPDGEKALQTALEYHPDLILLDIMMPKVSGFDVLDILRNTKETAHTKIIILTALSQPSDKLRAKELGADEFLVKSQAIIADVMKRIRYHLGIKEPAPQAEPFKP